ncbi:alpha/beta hydrolase, partial [Pseudomonas fluorescens LMG 5329]
MKTFKFSRVAAALITGALALGVATASVAAPQKATVVLVHGAFADASSWNGVIAGLKAEGY